MFGASTDFEEMERVKNKLNWPKDFGEATVILPYEKLRKYRNYVAAKAGDEEAAVKLIDDVVKESLVKWMQEKYPGSIVVSVQAIEAKGRNKLPVAFATKIADVNEFENNFGIVQENKPQRTGKDALHRLIYRSVFSGNVQQGGNYIIVDDVITQGGTLNDLRKYIQSKGGNVVHAAALSAGMQKSTGAESKVMKIKEETVKALYSKFGTAVDEMLFRFKIAEKVSQLTESEAQYILGFPNLTPLIRKILERLGV